MDNVQHAKLKLSHVDAITAPLEAERTARLLAKACSRDTLADLLASEMTAQQQVVRALQDSETRLFVVSRALELHRYREGVWSSPLSR